MAKINEVSSRVRDYWIASGLNVRPVLGSDLVLLRHRFASDGIADYLQFLSIAGLPTDEDANQFRFWMPHELAPSNEVLLGTGFYSTAEAQAESGLIFADYMHESWWYRICLEGAEVGKIRRAGSSQKDRQAPPMGSMCDFLEAYLRDDDCLYQVE